MNFENWDGNLDEYSKKLMQVMIRAREFGIETIAIMREDDRLGNAVNYRYIRQCDHVVAIGLLTLALGDVQTDLDEQEPEVLE